MRVGHGRENEQLRHQQDLEHARHECEHCRAQAAAGLRAAADEAAIGNLSVALKRATAAMGDLETAQRACEHWRSLNPLD